MPDFFDKAVEAVLDHEGNFSNHPNDPGGTTQYGISLRFLKDYTNINRNEFDRFDLDDDGDIDATDIKGLSKEDATYLYRRSFWDKHNYDRFGNYLVARKVFDLAVNMGSAQAHKLLQRAVRASTGIVLLEDGMLGPKTMKAVNAADGAALLSALRSEASGFYRLLAKVDPKLDVFLGGWINRAYF